MRQTDVRDVWLEKHCSWESSQTHRSWTAGAFIPFPPPHLADGSCPHQLLLSGEK